MSEITTRSQVRFSEKTDPADMDPLLVPLADIKSFFGVTDSALDAQLTLAAAMVSAAIRTYTGRMLTHGQYTETFTDVFEPKTERYLIETPIDNYSPTNVGSLLNKNTGRIVLTGGPSHTVTYFGGYQELPRDLYGVFVELVRQQMAFMGHDTIGNSQAVVAPPEKAVWVGTLKVEYAVGANSTQAKATGGGGFSEDALAPYAWILDSYRSRTRLVAT